MLNLEKQTTQSYFLNEPSVFKWHFSENLLLKYDKRKCIYRSKMVEYFLKISNMETLLLQMERKCIHSVSVQTPNGEELFLLLFTCLHCYCSVLVFFGIVIFSLLITFGNWNNFWQPLVIVKSFIRIHMKYSETCQEILGKNWKE